MKSAFLITMMTAAATGFGSAFADAEDIALSLVHPKGRIDVPVGGVSRVEPQATIAIRNTQTGEVHEYPDPHVEICFVKDIKARICQLTQQIVGQPMAIVIDCETVTKPIVREPLCTRACIQLSANDIAEAVALAQRIRRGTNRACAPST